MDIQFTEEQELLRSSVQRLLRDQYDFETRRKIVATEEGWSRKHWNAFAEMGLLAAPFSEAFGGLGGGPLSTMIVMQEFGRHLVVEPFFETVVLAGGLIENVGTDAQREELLPAIMGGEAIFDPDLKSRVEAELGLPLLNGYGITECAPGISGVRIEAPRPDSAVGQIVPGVEGRIIDRDGKLAANGAVGELHVRGKNVMLGYYRAPDLTEKVIDRDGWFNTGDLAYLDGDCMFIVGRTKEMIIRSGFNVYPAEVEAVLSLHDAVVQSAVVGRAADGNEEVVAFVQLLKGSNVTPSELMAFASKQLTSYKRPSQIIVLDALPATSTGKILKHKLAESLRGT